MNAQRNTVLFYLRSTQERTFCFKNVEEAKRPDHDLLNSKSHLGMWA